MYEICRFSCHTLLYGTGNPGFVRSNDWQENIVFHTVLAFVVSAEPGVLVFACVVLSLSGKNSICSRKYVAFLFRGFCFVGIALWIFSAGPISVPEQNSGLFSICTAGSIFFGAVPFRIIPKPEKMAEYCRNCGISCCLYSIEKIGLCMAVPG